MTDSESVKSLQEQVDALQAQLRRLESRGGNRLLLCIILVAALGCVSLVSFTGCQNDMSAESELRNINVGHIRAESLTLSRDGDQNKVFIYKSGLSICGDGGQEQVLIGSEGGGGIFLKTEGGKKAVSIQAMDWGGVVSVYNGREKIVGLLEATVAITPNTDAGKLVLFDSSGTKRGLYDSSGTKIGEYLLGSPPPFLE